MYTFAIQIYEYMADYKGFFKREQFLKRMQAAKSRKRAWEKSVKESWEELDKQLKRENIVVG